MYAIRSYYGEFTVVHPFMAVATGRNPVGPGDSRSKSMELGMAIGALQLMQAAFVPDGVVNFRITSYNVCYTKLLRGNL